MIILDTNVLSEPTKERPSEAVIAWLTTQPDEEQFTTAVTQAEIFFGAERLPVGKRRQRLVELAALTFEVRFAGRILPFDASAARLYPSIVLARQRAGRPIAQLDAMIAAIARAHNALLATRNAADFADCGIQVFDPWRYHK